MKPVSDIQELIRIIATSSFGSSVAKNISVEIKTRNNGIVKGVVTGSIYKGSKMTDVVSIRTFKIDNNLLWSHVNDLLRKGTSFIIRTGPICDTCLFQWTISED